ncbi:MAG: phosphoenolpyruvate--protein phosphotransferase [Corynebacteriales bacterium]|nr:phosphoenolpyruvate--protein phosphotransferase [Mycobacteriales bacterium]
MTVGLVIVSHSAQLAEGVCEVARQMAPDVHMVAAGGTDEGTVGTSFEKTLDAINEISGETVVLFDLGSARMTSELVLEVLDEEQQKNVLLVDAPLVEGAIAAAVSAQSGAGLTIVAAAAQGRTQESESAPDQETVSETFRLRNPLGLHARPAASLARLAAEAGVGIHIGANDRELIDARSVLGVVGLGLRGGNDMTVRITGPSSAGVLRRISELVEDGFGELGDAVTASAPPTGIKPSAPLEAHILQGVGAVPGIGVGQVVRLTEIEPDIRDSPAPDIAQARLSLQQALSRVDTALVAEGTSLGLAQAHRALLADPVLHDTAYALVDAGHDPSWSWWEAVKDARGQLAKSTDALIAERASDVTDVGLRVLRELGSEAVGDFSLPPESSGAIVAAQDVVPSLVPTLAEAGVAGLALAHSGLTSHTVIVARGLGIPTVVALDEALDKLPAHATVILDGETGKVNIKPTEGHISSARVRQAAAKLEKEAAASMADAPVFGKDGARIHVAANVASVAEARAARANGADGVGLLRTELLFLERKNMPTEDEQRAALAAIFAEIGARQVVVRTLDVGGDKTMPALHLDPVRNGFLGERGLRYSLAYPDTLHTQLRAIMRAAAGWPGKLAIMAPMVTVVEEVRAFRTAIDEAIRSLRADNADFRAPAEVGIMVEVPAAALAAEQLCAEVDFVSVGSNDLVQYVMAAERTNDAVSQLYQPDHPALWRILELLTAGAGVTQCRVAVCGEMATNAKFAPRLIELGVTELSMNPTAIGTVKAALRSSIAN